MSEDPVVRPAEPDDADRIREIARSSMTTSYALSPDDIESILEDAFAEDGIRRGIEGEGLGPYVAVADDVVSGFVDIGVDDDTGTVQWLHVDPERRGGGVGTTLFERAVDELDDTTDDVVAVTLAANTSSGSFFERFDFEQVDERTTELGGRETTEYVFAEEASAGAADDRADPVSVEQTAETDSARPTSSGESVEPTARDDLDLPDSVETDDGETVSLGEPSFGGSEGGFVTTYANADRSEQYGYYCVNCGSTDVAVDSTERVHCNDCGNTSRPGEDYDASYL